MNVAALRVIKLKEESLERPLQSIVQATKDSRAAVSGCLCTQHAQRIRTRE